MQPGKKSFLLLIVIFAALQGILYGEGRVAAEERKGTDPVIVTGKEEGEVIIESEIPFEERRGYAPAGEYVNQAGKQHWLKDWHLEPCRIPERRESVESTAIYEGVEWEGQIPKQAAVTLRDKMTGRQLQKDYPILRMEAVKERWLSDFTFTAVFHSYGADYYQLGTKKIPFNSHKPELKDCGQELLEEIGAEPEKYRVLDAVWQGDPYFDENGNFCRDAAVTGEKKVADYYVTYGGEMVFPEADGVRCVAVYRGFDSVTDGWDPAEERPVELKNFSAGTEEKKGKWLVIRKSVVVTLSVLFAGGVIVLFITLVRRACRKKKKEGVKA
ncbi:hypothetical protein [Clostridium sp. Marseille-P2415]|uniref:hypothetical protein n=1 Tax=Clostridium sp. Marseille-P2415 TaxID=1805471 RepID=UPI0009886FDD|nr:hypothetical protein [Clostridium sp. Marseille-P2415]